MIKNKIPFYPKRQPSDSFIKGKTVNLLLQFTINKGICTMIFPHVLTFLSNL